MGSNSRAHDRPGRPKRCCQRHLRRCPSAAGTELGYKSRDLIIFPRPLTALHSTTGQACWIGRLTVGRLLFHKLPLSARSARNKNNIARQRRLLFHKPLCMSAPCGTKTIFDGASRQRPVIRMRCAESTPSARKSARSAEEQRLQHATRQHVAKTRRAENCPTFCAFTPMHRLSAHPDSGTRNPDLNPEP
jgi:hypothetical protein